jgi:hypothetical protein
VNNKQIIKLSNVLKKNRIKILEKISNNNYERIICNLKNILINRDLIIKKNYYRYVNNGYLAGLLISNIKFNFKYIINIITIKNNFYDISKIIENYFYDNDIQTNELIELLKDLNENSYLDEIFLNLLLFQFNNLQYMDVISNRSNIKHNLYLYNSIFVSKSTTGILFNKLNLININYSNFPYNFNFYVYYNFPNKKLVQLFLDKNYNENNMHPEMNNTFSIELNNNISQTTKNNLTNFTTLCQKIDLINNSINIIFKTYSYIQISQIIFYFKFNNSKTLLPAITINNISDFNTHFDIF